MSPESMAKNGKCVGFVCSRRLFRRCNSSARIHSFQIYEMRRKRINVASPQRTNNFCNRVTGPIRLDEKFFSSSPSHVPFVPRLVSSAASTSGKNKSARRRQIRRRSSQQKYFVESENGERKLIHQIDSRLGAPFHLSHP